MSATTETPHPLPVLAAEPAVWKRVLLLALPTLAQQLILFFIQHYDQWLAARFSSEHRAALTTANYLYWFFSSYSVVVSAGATALVGRMVGAKDWLTANRATGQAIILAVVFGGLASVIATLGFPSLMQALQLEQNTAAIAVQYLTPLGLVLILQLLETAGIACLVGAGNTWFGPMVLGLVAAVNLPLAWLLSGGGGPAWDYGFTGIALGTAISHGVGGLVVLIVLFRGLSGIHLTLARLVPNGALLYRLLRVSIPAALDSLSTAVCQLYFLSIVNRLGIAASSAHGIALRWEALGYLAGAGFAPTAMAVVSQSLGQKRSDLAARGGWAAFGLGAAVMCVMGVLFYVLADPMCRLYTNQPNEISMATNALRLIAFAMPAVAAWIIMTHALRAAGDTRVPVLFTWLGFLGVRIPLALYLTQEQVHLLGYTLPGAGLGLIGAWIAMVSDLYLRGGLLVFRFAGGRWKTMKV
jgi:putative MATE family efflux protein